MTGSSNIRRGWVPPPGAAGGDATVAVGTGVADAVGTAVATQASSTVVVGTGSATAAGTAVASAASSTVAVGTGAATASGSAAATQASSTAAVGTGTATASGSAVAAQASSTVVVGTGVADASGTAAVPTSGGVTDATVVVGTATATADGSAVAVVVIPDFVPPAPPDIGGGGGRYEPGGDETSIYGLSARVVVGTGEAWASGTAARPLRIAGVRVVLPPRRVDATVRVGPSASRASGAAVTTIASSTVAVDTGAASASGTGAHGLELELKPVWRARVAQLEEDLAVVLLALD